MWTSFIMIDLPEEVIVDILSKLPVKTIIHCKCVCKKWRNLVSSSYFVNLHLSRSLKGLIIHHKPINTTNYWHYLKDPGFLRWVEIEDKVDGHHLHDDPLMSFDLNLTPILQNTEIDHMCSVNGLICLWQCCPELDNTYICNPITREYIILPSSLATKVYGFGVSSLTGEYKVVRAFEVDIPPNAYKSSPLFVFEAEVYTLSTGQWRSLGRVPYWLNGFFVPYGPFLHNHCHWIVCDEDVHEELCTFDLDKETFQLFPSPPPEAIPKCRFHLQSLAVLKGCLCKLDNYDSELKIWVMKEYGIKKSWHKEVVIRPGISYEVTWLMCRPMFLIEGLKDGSLLMACRGKLLACCPQSDRMEETEILDDCISAVTYRPSFLKLQNFDSERVHMF